MRNDAREAAFKIVFASLFHDDCGERFKESVYKKDALSDEERGFADRLVALTEEHKDDLLQTINENVTHFADYRIYPVDKAILLIALAEIKFCKDIPNVVSVSEAAGLARKFSTENSAGFVNGVLGGIINE